MTDANLVLGFLGPEGIADGRVELRPDLAESALKRSVADPLGLDVSDAAWGVHVLANVGMEAALRAVSVERGRSPSDYVLVAYGGAGPMHAATLAAAFEIPTVVIPPQAGLLCAYGLTLAGIRQDAVQAYPLGATVEGWRLEPIVKELASILKDRFSETEGPEIELTYQLTVRYSGQPTELLISLEPATDLMGDVSSVVKERFLTEHERTYGYADAYAPMEVTSVRAAATRLAGSPIEPKDGSHRSTPGRGPIGQRRVYFGPADGWWDTDVYQDRHSVRDAAGPLIVEEADTTVVVPPGWRANCDDSDRLRLDREAT